MDQDIDQPPGEDILAESSITRLEEVSNNTTLHIYFKIRDRGTRKFASAHRIGRFDFSEIEKVATNWVQGKWKLFNTELRILASQQCYEAIIDDGTYTVLVMREPESNIDYEVLLFAMKNGLKAKELARPFEHQEDPEEIL